MSGGRFYWFVVCRLNELASKLVRLDWFQCSVAYWLTGSGLRLSKLDLSQCPVAH